MTEVSNVPVSDVSPNPRNPRENFNSDKIAELAESIEEQGLLQAPLVRPVNDGYELVHGERRYRAVKKLEWNEIRVKIRDLSDRQAFQIAVSENLQREEVSEVAEARSYQALTTEFDMTQQEVADKLGVSQSHVANRIGLLELPERLQEDILCKIFSPWQAKELARVWGDYYLRDLALDWNLTVKEVRAIVDDLQAGEVRVAIEDELSASELANMWDYRFIEVDEGGPVLPVFFDSRGEELEELGYQCISDGYLWAKRNIDAERYGIYDGKFDNENVAPIQIHYPSNRIIYGYFRLLFAESNGYTGDFEVEWVWNRSFFEWDSYVGTGGASD